MHCNCSCHIQKPNLRIWNIAWDEYRTDSLKSHTKRREGNDYDLMWLLPQLHRVIDNSFDTMMITRKNGSTSCINVCVIYKLAGHHYFWTLCSLHTISHILHLDHWRNWYQTHGTCSWCRQLWTNQVYYYEQLILISLLLCPFQLKSIWLRYGQPLE